METFHVPERPAMDFICGVTPVPAAKGLAAAGLGGSAALSAAAQRASVARIERAIAWNVRMSRLLIRFVEEARCASCKKERARNAAEPAMRKRVGLRELGG